MAAELGADSLFYLPLDAVARCIDVPAERLCRACMTGEYPTPTGESCISSPCGSTRRRRGPHLRAARVRPAGSGSGVKDCGTDFTC